MRYKKTMYELWVWEGGRGGKTRWQFHSATWHLNCTINCWLRRPVHVCMHLSSVRKTKKQKKGGERFWLMTSLATKGTRMLIKWLTGSQGCCFLGAITRLRKATVSVVIPICSSAWNNSDPAGRILMKTWYLSFFCFLSKIKSHWNSTRITGTLHEGFFTFIISRWIILRIKNVLDRSCTENQTAHFIFNNDFFFENLAVYETMSENMVEPEGPQITSQYGAYELYAG